jgi:hypothetical protein
MHGADGQDPHIGPNFQGEDQEQINLKHRRSALVGVLELVQRQQTGAVDLVTIVDALGLEEQLDELAGSRRRNGERHRRLAAAREAAGLVDDLDDDTVAPVRVVRKVE